MESINRRTERMKDRLKDFENEVKIFNQYANEILLKSLAKVKNMHGTEDMETYLTEYTTLYSYLSKCASVFSEFNCKLEILRIELDYSDESDKINSSSNLSLDSEVNNLSPLLMEKLGEILSAGSDFGEIYPEPTVNVCNDGKFSEDEKSFEVQEGLGDVKRKNRVITEDPETISPNDKENVCSEKALPDQQIHQINPTESESKEPLKEEGTEYHSTLNAQNNIYMHEFQLPCYKLMVQGNQPGFSGYPGTGSSFVSEASGISPANMANSFYLPYPYRYMFHPQILNDQISLQNKMCSPPPSAQSNDQNPNELQFTLPQNKNIHNKECLKSFKNGDEPSERKVLGVENIGYKTNLQVYMRPLRIDRTIGTLYNVIISHVESPDEFYVHVECEDSCLLDDMNVKIKRHTESYLKRNMEDDASCDYNKRKIKAGNEMGLYALGYSNDRSCWNRVKILSWEILVENDLVHVFYVDHGNTEYLPLKHLIPTNEIIKKYPIFVQKCYLPNLLPNGSEQWTEEHKTTFELFTQSSEQMYHLKIEIVENDTFREDGALGVNLIIPKTNIIINDKLIEYDVAVVSAASSANLGAKELKVSDSNEDTLKYNYRPPYSIGDVVPVRVICLSGLKKFCCIEDYEKTNQTDLVSNLSSQLNSDASISSMIRLNAPPKVNDLVLGKYEEGWYRAKVVKSDPKSDNYKLLYLDYGNTGKASLEDMRKMKNEYLKIPFQMMECHLGNVCVNNVSGLMKAIKFMNNEMEEGGISIKIERVLKKDPCVYNVKVLNAQGKDIEEELFLSGFAD